MPGRIQTGLDAEMRAAPALCREMLEAGFARR
jgi:hypothetical protein